MKFKKIYIEITNKCNLNCSFCYQSKKVKRDMSVNEFEHVIHEIKQVSKNIYLHVKGEPLLHPQLDKLLLICDENEMRVNITTNGTLIQKVKDILIKHPCVKKINFSLHCENEYLDYLTTIFKCVDELSTSITIVYRLWTLNNHTFDEKSLKIISSIKNYYRLNDVEINLIKQKQNAKVTNNVYIDKDNEFKWPSLHNELQNEVGFCHALKTHIAILANGDVVPCCLDGEGIIKLGNLHKQNLHSIISNDRFNRVKKSFQDRKPCEELCKKCGFNKR